VLREEFIVDIRVRGELDAASQTTVSVPDRVYGNARITKLVEDGSMTEEGGFLIQFDTSESEERVTDRLNELENAKAEMASTQASIESNMKQLESAYQTQQFSYEQSKLRYEMMNELSKEEPDSLKLDKIADKIGLWHATLKKETIRHFVQIRRNCNVEQRRSLSKIYRKMQEPPERGFGRNWKEGESRKINSRNSNRSGNRERGQMNRRNKDNQ